MFTIPPSVVLVALSGGVTMAPHAERSALSVPWFVVPAIADDDAVAGVFIGPAGDTNGDDLDDLITGSFGGVTVQHYAGLVLGDAGGPIGAPLWYTPLGSPDQNDAIGPRSWAVGDVDGDGFPDVLIARPGESSEGYEHNGVVRLHLGTPSGLSAQSSWSYVGDQTGDYPYLGVGATIAAGDFDADGFADVALSAGYLAGQVVVFFGSASGLPTTPDVVLSPFDVVLTAGTTSTFGGVATVADDDGDGDDELAVLIGVITPPAEPDAAELVDYRVGVWRPQAGSFASTPATTHVLDADPQPLALLASELGFAVGDFDGDAIADAVAILPPRNTGDLSMTRRRVVATPLAEPGEPWSFESPPDVPAFFDPSMLTIGDFDGDNLDDLAVCADSFEGPTLFVVRGSSTGLRKTPQIVLAGAGLPVRIATGVAGLGDVDGDGRDDLGVAGTVELLVYPGAPAAPECDGDDDLDGACNADDNCLTAFNPTQADFDGDGVGDLCEFLDGGSSSGGEGSSSSAGASSSTGDGTGAPGGGSTGVDATTSSAGDSDGTGPGQDALDESGCECNANDRPTGAAWFALVAALVAMPRRRRPR